MKNPRFDTSLYNHKPLSDGKKPLISNAEFSELLKRVKDGDIDYYTHCKEMFVIELKQDKLINDIINNRII